jgi:predicted phage tail protein
MNRLRPFIIALILASALLRPIAQETTPEPQPGPTTAADAAPLPTDVPAEAPAQTAAPAETPAQTAAPTETPAQTAAPTENPAQTAAPTETTPEATAEPPVIITPEATPADSGVALTPVVVPPLSPLRPFALALRELFGAPPGDDWIVPPGWAHASDLADGGIRCLPAEDDTPAPLLLAGLYADVEAEALYTFAAGSAYISVRHSEAGSYTLALAADGALRLLRDDIVLAETHLALAGPQVRLALRADGAALTALVEGEIALSALDDDPLPAGGLAFGGADNGQTGLLLSQVFVRVPEDMLPPTPPAAPTSAPLPEATPADDQTAGALGATPTPAGPLVVGDATPRDRGYAQSLGLPDDAGALVAPANDNLNNASDVTNPFYYDDDYNYVYRAQDVTDATLQAGEVVPPCLKTTGSFNNTVWYRVTPPVSHNLYIDTASLSFDPSDFDTFIAVYQGSATLANNVACNDDAVIFGRTISRVLLPVQAGQTYYVQFGRSGTGSLGAGNLYVWMEYALPPTGIAAASPANGARFFANPLLTWTNTGSATSFEIQIDNNSNFSSPEVTQSEIAVTNFIPVTPLPSGTYYWRVRGTNYNGVPSAWTAARSFIVSNPSLPPMLNAPADGGFVTMMAPTLSWQALVGAARYMVEVSSAPDFSANLFTYNPMGVSVVAGPNLRPGQWYWRVTPVDSANNAGTTSAVRTFTVNPQTAPAANAVLTTTNAAPEVRPVFTWVAPRTSANILIDAQPNVQVATDAGFASVVSESGPLAKGTASWQPATGLAYGQYFWRVVFSGLPEVSPVMRSFMVVPPVPRLLTPANNTTVITATPLLAWEGVTVTSATPSYEIQVATSSAFTTVVFTQGGIAGTNVTPSSLADGTYFWRARSVNDDSGPSAYSAPFSFRVVTTLPQASLLSPLNNSVVSASRPVFRWNALAGITRFRLQVARDGNFGAPQIDQIVTGTTFTSSITLEQGEYQWRVRPVDASSFEGGWSLVFSFALNVQLTPANASFTTMRRPTFTWAAVPGAVEYVWEIACDAAFSDTSCLPGGFQNTVSRTTTNYAIPATQPELPFRADYHWRVNVNYGAGVVASPLWRTLTVTPPPPAAPTLNAPAAGFATALTSFNLVWNELLPTAPGAPFTYDVQVGNATFTTLAVNQTGVSGGTLGVALPNGTYSWRVRAVNSVGVAGPFSAPRAFTIDDSAPNLLLPADGAVTTLSRPTFTWQATKSSKTYRLQINDTNDFGGSAVFEVDEIVNTTSRMLTISLPQGAYFWRVIPLDGAGNPGAPSVVRTFTINIQVAPAHDFSSTNRRPVLSWAAVPGPMGVTVRYQVQVATDNAFTQDLQTFADQTTTSLTLPELAFDEYFWRVNVKYDGVALTLSPHARRFVVASVIPSAVTLVAPANALLTTNTTPAFQWNPATGGTTFNYEIQVDNNNTFASPEAQTTTAATTFTPGAPLADGLYYWRVRAINEQAAAGPYSMVRTFTVDTTPPAAPTLLNPPDAGSVTTLTPAFSWLVSPTATGYILEWDTSGAFGLPRAYTAAGTAFTPPAPLLATVIHWRVRAVDAAGNVSAPSAVRTLTINTPTNMAPTPNRHTTATPTLTWTPVTGALGYEVQVFPVATFTGTPAWQNLAVPAGTTSVTTDALPPGTYFWRVRARLTATTFGPYAASGPLVINP